jgi:metal-responsive CopG/Arc/MetJ family transcriptional regulator
MAQSIKVSQNKRGRPATGRDPVSAVRLPELLTRNIDRWAEKSEISRSEAIRQLVEIGLSNVQPAAQRIKKTAVKASELAEQAIDRLSEPSATDAENAFRKDRLLKGPKEFRDVRGDLSKPKR